MANILWACLPNGAKNCRCLFRKCQYGEVGNVLIIRVSPIVTDNLWLPSFNLVNCPCLFDSTCFPCSWP